VKVCVGRMVNRKKGVVEFEAFWYRVKKSCLKGRTEGGKQGKREGNSQKAFFLLCFTEGWPEVRKRREGAKEL